MADLNEPKKETVRITLPPPAPPNPAESDKETARINLPSRPPGAGPAPVRPPAAVPIRPPAASVAPTQTPLPAPSAVTPATAQTPGIPPRAPDIADGASAGPHKETARVAITPDSPMKATVRLSNIQPSSAPPGGVVSAAPLSVASPPPAALVEGVPATFCWALLGVSALTLLIQLWTYFS